MIDELKTQILSILDDTEDMTIATIRPDGFPQATKVSYMNDGMTIYLGTSSDSRQAQNIADNDKVSLTISCPHKIWDEIKGLSLAGRASLVTDTAEYQHACGLMFTKYPRARATNRPNGHASMAIFRIDPIGVPVIDFNRFDGHYKLVTV